jgi:hypothetical protein
MSHKKLEDYTEREIIEILYKEILRLEEENETLKRKLKASEDAYYDALDLPAIGAPNGW